MKNQIKRISFFNVNTTPHPHPPHPIPQYVK